MSKVAIAARAFGLIYGSPFGPEGEPEPDVHLSAQMTCVEDVASWAGVCSINELEGLLSEKFRARISLDEGDIGLFDLDGWIIAVDVYDCRTKVPCPFPVSELFEAIVSGHEHSTPGLAQQEVEQRVLGGDRGREDRDASACAPDGHELGRVGHPQHLSVPPRCKWHVHRFRMEAPAPSKKLYPGFDVAVLLPNGATAPGQMRMSSLRRQCRDADAS